MSVAAPGWEIRHFRITSSVLIGLAAILVGLGRTLGAPSLLELGLAILVLAAGFRLLLESSAWGRSKLITLHPKHFFLDSWRQIDAEAAAERLAVAEAHAQRERKKRFALRFADVLRDENIVDVTAEPRARVELLEQEADRRVERELEADPIPAPYDYRPLIALASGAICLAIMEYFGHSQTFMELIDHYDPPFHEGPATNFAGTIRNGQFLELWEFVWWSAFRVLGYLILPALVVKLVFRERLRDQGLETKGFREHAWIYVLGYCVVFVCVIFVSRNDEGFQTYYPFYHYAGRSWFDFGCWEVLYAAQFFSLEFFFRGFWLRAMKRQLGSYAIFAMVVPYCMIHFGKPFPETLAAIVAGVFLGTLSMKTRSIWSGFLIHVSVAISMDLASLAVASDWPVEMWPPGW